MIKFLPISLLFLLSTGLCYSQNGELPTELAIKLDDQAKTLFPEDARAQQRWIDKQTNAFETISYIEVSDKEDADNFKKATETAAKLYPLDFEARMKFLNDAVIALSTITSYKTYFPAEEQNKYEDLKSKVLAENPQDYKAAAKAFEKKIQAVIEIDSIPFPENVDEVMHSAIKGAAARAFKDDYVKQKEFVEKWSERFMAFAAYEAEMKAKAEAEAKGGAQAVNEKLEKSKSFLKDTVFTIKSEQESMGYCVMIQGKPVILFSAHGFDPRSISIENKFSESAKTTELFVSKNSPFIIAPLRNPDESVKTLPLADSEKVKGSLEKPVILLHKNGTSIDVNQNKVAAITSNALVLSRKLQRDSIYGTSVINLDDNSLMAMLVPLRKFDDVSDFTNKSYVKNVQKTFDNEKVDKVVLRLDTLGGAWEKIDTSKYSMQVEALKAIEEKSKDFLMFFSINSLASMESIDSLNPIYTKYNPIFGQRQDKATQIRNIKNMLQDVVAEMNKDISRINLDQLYFPLREEYSYNIAIRNAMIDYLNKIIRSGNVQPFFFRDISTNSK